jgi:hypothetical protein
VRYSGEWNQLKIPYATIVSSIDLYATGSALSRSPVAGVVLGSCDGEHWYKLTEFSGKTYTTDVATKIDVNATTPYQYYRIVVSNVGTSPADGRCELNEIYYFAEKPVTRMENVHISGDLSSETLHTSYIKWPRKPLKANESEGYVASASENTTFGGGLKPWKAFNNIIGNLYGWSTFNNRYNSDGTLNTSTSFQGYDGHWLKISMPQSIVPSFMLFYPYEDARQFMRAGKILASNDEITWDVISSFSDVIRGEFDTEPHRINISAHKSYSSFAVVVSENNGLGWLAIDEWEIYEAATGVGAAPTSAKLQVAGSLGMAKGSEFFAGDDVVMELPKHDRPLVKYPEVAMTANSSGGYVASGSSVRSSYAFYTAFDGLSSTNAWQSQSDTFTNGVANQGTFEGITCQYISIDLGHTIALQYVDLYSRSSADTYAPVKGKIYGSNDETKYELVASYDNLSMNANENVRIVANTNKYFRYFTFTVEEAIASGSENSTLIRELEYWGHEEGDTSVDVVHRSIPNKPSPQHLGVYWDAADSNSYSFADSSNVYDLSGSGVTGAITGTNGFDAEYNAWVFDGNGDYISGTLTNSAGAWVHSVSLWLKSSTYTGQIMYIGNADATNGRIAIIPSSTGTITIGISASNVSYAGALPLDSNWHHLIYTYSGGISGTGATGYNLYVDGVNIVQTGGVGDGTLSLDINQNFFLGSGLDGGASFNGSIANFRLFGKALSAEQVRELYDYDAERFGHRQNVVALHKGNLGVGTTSPIYTLDVHGTANVGALTATTGAFSSNLEVGTANLFVDTQTGNVGIGTTSPATNLDVHGTSNVGALTATTGAFSSNLEVGTANLFVDTQTGNVGIGTNSAEALLHIVDSTAIDSSSEVLRLQRGIAGVGDINSASRGTIGMYLEDNNVGGGEVARISWAHDGGNSTAEGLGQLGFWTSQTGGDADGVPVERMTIRANGNVGIGTTAPATNLDVHGTSNVGALTATTATVPNDGDFIMNSKPLVSTTGLHWDRVNSRLGVGTNSPAYKLDVAGDISSSGTISGNGSGLTNLNATNLASGTVNNNLLNTASITGAGIVQLSTSTSGTSTTKAATESAVKAAYDRSSWGSGTFSGDVTVSGNFIVSGTTTTVDTTNLTIKDPIVELGKDNTVGTTDLGIIMRRPGSNVGIIYDGSASKLEIGHTLNGGSDSTITMDTANALTVNVNGELSVPNDGDFIMNSKPLVSATGLHWDRLNSRLGVGTTSPVHPLDVNGTARATQLYSTGLVRTTHVSLGTARYPTLGGNWLTIQSPTFDGAIGDNHPDPDGGILFTNTSSSGAFPWGYYMGVVKDVASTNTTSLRFDIGKSNDLNTDTYTSGADTLTPYLTIDNGNVGIGTTDPSYNLDVHGTSNVGALTTTSVSGDGSGLSALNASNVTTGTISKDRLPTTLNNTTIGSLAIGANDVTLTAKENYHGLKILKTSDSPNEPATLLLAGDGDPGDDIAFEIRGNETGSGVDTTTTINSDHTTFGILHTGHTYIGYPNLNPGETGGNAQIGDPMLNVSGDIYATGNITAYSDKRAKSDIQKIENALDKIDQLNGYTFTMNDKRYTGVIAQEVLPVLPEAVTGSEETKYAVAYGNMIGLIIEAIKELKEKIG